MGCRPLPGHSTTGPRRVGRGEPAFTLGARDDAGVKALATFDELSGHIDRTLGALGMWRLRAPRLRRDGSRAGAERPRVDAALWSGQVTTLRDFVERWMRGEIPLAPIATLLNVTPLSLGKGSASVTMEAGASHHNAMGTVHGGVFGDLADVAMGIALATVAGEGETFATLELHISYFRPVTAGRLTANARVVHRGRETAHLECDLSEGDRLVARARSVCLIRRPGAG